MSNTVRVTIKAPAKVNLFLRVLRKRPDGYHDIISVMQALDLADVLTVERIPSGIELVCDDPDVPTGDDNIICRAAKSVIAESALLSGVRFSLEKNIPMAAGLGGGSSDAAAAIKGMLALFGLDIPRKRLMEIARTLGADVPFFLFRPCARAEGVGEVLSELPPPAETWLVLVNPGFAVSTKWVYENLSFMLTNPLVNITLPPFDGQTGRVLDGVFLDEYLVNDLEDVTVGRHPKVRELKEKLLTAGALGAMMSGSGPTVFGVFRDRDSAEAAATGLRLPDKKVLVTRTIAEWPELELASL